MSVDSYEKAGVDIEKGDRFAEFIKNYASKAVGNIGGFAGGIELDLARYRKPVILSTTDGVGTKLLVAMRLEKFDTVGIDLVAMNVNDLVVCGAAPVVFLDYIACGHIDEALLQEVITGVIHGCEEADCILAGGETAEMPDLYKGRDFDLAGFAVGIAEKDGMLPRLDQISAGDILLGLPSTGVHSNGYSLARKVIPASDRTLNEILLTPTKIYVHDMLTLLQSKKILAAAHITGSGLMGNTVRVIPQGLVPRFSFDWPEPPIFDIIRKKGKIQEEEMRKVFNLGLGMIVVVKRDDADAVMELSREKGIDIRFAGEVVSG
ncbi:MAG TPA: phosphoribosylformylglycinamidine cyclo-ligase [Spirochaetia bacterium]|nr:phosphoribosylformylglycinamidine cyclo-ligase [Spirochaetia bacterium]